MSVQVYGCNHVAIEVDDIKKAIAFYKDVFNLEKLDSGEGDAFFKLGEHQFLAIFEVEKLQPGGMRHFGIMVRDEAQLAEVRRKITGKYKLKLEPPFRCDFHDPWGNRIQVVDLHDESLIWLLPYREVQKAGIKFKEDWVMQLANFTERFMRSRQAGSAGGPASDLTPAFVQLPRGRRERTRKVQRLEARDQSFLFVPFSQVWRIVFLMLQCFLFS